MPPARTYPAVPSGSIVAAEPQLLVRNLATSLDFYTTKLGFQAVFAYGEPAFYAQVSRQGGRLNLRSVRYPIYHPDFLSREPDVLAATLIVSDPELIFAELREAGVKFYQQLKTEAWGARTFIVCDPDGNLLCFAGEARRTPWDEQQITT